MGWGLVGMTLRLPVSRARVLGVLSVTLLPAEQMVVTGPRSGRLLSGHRVVAAVDRVQAPGASVQRLFLT